MLETSELKGNLFQALEAAGYCLPTSITPSRQEGPIDLTWFRVTASHLIISQIEPSLHFAMLHYRHVSAVLKFFLHLSYQSGN